MNNSNDTISKNQNSDIEIIDNNDVTNDIEIVEDTPNKKDFKKTYIIIAIIIILLLLGGLLFYIFTKKNNKFINDKIVINTSKSDIGNYFMNILKANKYNYESLNNYDITINYGNVLENTNISINFSSKNCDENEDTNCSYFNKKKTINVYINDKKYNYYTGYNNSYDVIGQILETGFIALLNNNNEIYIVNNSDTVKTWDLDEINKPHYEIIYINNKTSNKHLNIDTKYMDENNNFSDCPINYDRYVKSLTYCSKLYKYTIYGKEISDNKYEKLVGTTYSNYLTTTNSDKQKKHNYEKPTISNKDKSINELQGLDINETLNDIKKYYELGIEESFKNGIYQNNEITIDNISDYFVKRYLILKYKNKITKTITDCDQLKNYYDDSSKEVKDCLSYDNSSSYTIYNYTQLNKYYKELFNTTKNISKDEFDTCKFNNIQNEFICSDNNLITKDAVLIQKIENHEVSDDSIKVYVRTILDIRNNESNIIDSRYVYAKANMTGLIGRKNDIDYFSNKEYEDFIEKGQLYIFTFKKNSDNTYYWLSTKPI